MIYMIVAVAVFLLDVFIKGSVEKHQRIGEDKKIWKGRIILTKYYNKGAALNVLEKHPHLLLAVHSGIFGFLAGIFACLAGTKERPGLLLGLAMMVGGGANNLLDRIRKKHVVDYFSFSVKWKKLRNIVFNVSDLFVFLGGLLVVLFGRKK